MKRTEMEMVGEDEEGRAAAGRANSHVLPLSNKPFKPLKFFQYCQFYYKNSLRQNKKPVANPNIFKIFNMQSLRKRLYKPQMLNNLFAGCGCTALRMCWSFTATRGAGGTPLSCTLTSSSSAEMKRKCFLPLFYCCLIPLIRWLLVCSSYL